MQAWAILLLFALVLTGGCRRAGQVVEDRFVAPERFDIRAPSPEQWALRTNRRGPRTTEVCYQRRDGGAFLRVRVVPLEPGDQQVPLDVYAHRVFLKELQLDGGAPELESMTRVMLDEREAVAFTGERYERPVRWKVSSIILKSQGYVMTLTYSAKPELFEPLAGEFERLLRHFHVQLPGPFDPYVLGDLPMGAPGPSPGNTRARRKPAQAGPLIGPTVRELPF